jgi:hypothetical protein
MGAALFWQVSKEETAKPFQSSGEARKHIRRGKVGAGAGYAVGLPKQVV